MKQYQACFGATLIAAMALLYPVSARAHCDAMDGPVAKAAQSALEDGNVNQVLGYAPASAEAEIRAAFALSRKVRPAGGDARALADQAFMETVIRLHRAGEGAAYTGVKAAGGDYGPVVPAAEQAIATGDLTKLKAVLSEEIEHALRDRLETARKLRAVSLQPKTAEGVPHARERINAELGFITFAEALRQAAQGKGPEHHD